MEFLSENVKALVDTIVTLRTEVQDVKQSNAELLKKVEHDGVLRRDTAKELDEKMQQRDHVLEVQAVAISELKNDNNGLRTKLDWVLKQNK